MRQLSSVLQRYAREVGFFDELAERVPVRVPRGYGADLSEDGSSYYLLMEDMGGHRVIDQNEGMSLEDAARAIDVLAGWHAKFWGQAEQYVESGAALSIGDDLYRAVLPMVFGEGWTKIQAEMEVHPTIAEAAPRWIDKLPEMLDALSASPTTMVHGDYRADNIFFDDNNNEMVLLDFQITGLGSASYDLAYFVTQSLVPEVAGVHEKALFDRYVAALIAAGVSEEETGRLWDDYRVAALFCLVYPVVASRGMDPSDPRQYGLVDAMSRRCARAIDDLGLASLL
ncbi:MAG: phosphotransferase family protein [Acidimicrobiales bacterium]